ncbi:MAG: PAS domain-containing protein [Bradyrhizobium sp.]
MFSPWSESSVFSSRSDFWTLDFESANPTVVKSIKQRDLLNTWLRLYAPAQRVPRKADFQPARIEDELPDLVYMTVESITPPRLLIDSDGTRMSMAYGHTGRGRYLDEYLGTRLTPIVLPVYQRCLERALPVYTVSHVDDASGRIVAYERLLLPFSDSEGVTHVIASLKTISEDGGFEIRNLMRGNDALPTAKLRAVIDRELFHRTLGRIPSADVIEFS